MYAQGTRVTGLHGHRYELQASLGEGGGGEVYQAQGLDENRLVAVKFMLVQQSFRVEVIRFLREAQIGSLDHPNIVQTMDFGEHDGRPFIVMEYIDGGSARDRVLRQGVFPERDALQIALDVAEAMAHLEKHHVVHRDIKPGNIMLASDGTARLTDFGVAKVTGAADLPSLPAEIIPADPSRSLTITGGQPGTILYMSPEQVQGEEPDTRSDIYSLGVSLYELVTGQRPFELDRTLNPRKALFDLAGRIVNERPPDPRQRRANLSASTAELILTMLNKEPFRRYRTADDLTRAIRAILEAPVGSSILRGIFDALADPQLTRRAVVAAEIMGPPKALRGH